MQRDEFANDRVILDTEDGLPAAGQPLVGAVDRLRRRALAGTGKIEAERRPFVLGRLEFDIAAGLAATAANESWKLTPRMASGSMTTTARTAKA